MIKEGTVVSLRYRLTDPEGVELDRAEVEEPFQYLHGSGQIIPGLERALLGLTVGAKKQVVIPPADGYGEIDEQLITRAKKAQFPQGQDVKVGMQFAADVGQNQPVVFTITNIEGEDIDLDGNHPLAGVTLHFDVEVLAMRDATKEEKEHGHAHGPGGHHDH